MHAAAAVAAGVADVVVAYRAVRARSGATRFGGAKVASDGRQHPRRDDREPVVHAARRAHAGVVDRAQRDALHAPVRRDERGLRPRRRAAACVRGDESRRVGLPSGRSRSPTTRRRAGSRNRASACSTAARRPTERSRSSSRAASARPRCRIPRSGSRPSPAPGSSNRRSRPTTTGPTCRSWTRRSCSPGACSTTPGSGATRSTSR